MSLEDDASRIFQIFLEFERDPETFRRKIPKEGNLFTRPLAAVDGDNDRLIAACNKIIDDGRAGEVIEKFLKGLLPPDAVPE